MLCSTELNAATVAKKMGLSERTFFRRIREHGLSFQQVVDSIKFSSAKVYLANRDLTMNEISFLLGFAELSSFHRAFKRWSKTTPAQFRQELLRSQNLNKAV